MYIPSNYVLWLSLSLSSKGTKYSHHKSNWMSRSFLFFFSMFLDGRLKKERNNSPSLYSRFVITKKKQFQSAIQTTRIWLNTTRTISWTLFKQKKTYLFSFNFAYAFLFNTNSNNIKNQIKQMEEIRKNRDTYFKM